MVEIDNFILEYLYHAIGTGPQRITSFQLDGQTNEVVYARAKYESPEGETFWVTVQRTPSDVSI